MLFEVSLLTCSSPTDNSIVPWAYTHVISAKFCQMLVLLLRNPKPHSSYLLPMLTFNPRWYRYTTNSVCKSSQIDNFSVNQFFYPSVYVLLYLHVIRRPNIISFFFLKPRVMFISLSSIFYISIYLRENELDVTDVNGKHH